MSPRQQTLERKAAGLYPQWNPIDAPKGALLEARNCVIDREGVISKRRGYARYGITKPTQNHLFEFKDRLILHNASLLSYDSDGAGTWIDWTGTFDEPETGRRIRAAEARLSLYLATAAGIFSTPALTTSPSLAGIEAGVDLQGVLANGLGASWFTADRQVAYRVLFVRIDSNKREIVGEPSPREVVANAFTTGLTWSNVGTTVTVTHAAHGFSNGDTVRIKNSGDPNIPDGSFVILNVLAGSYDFVVAVAPTLGPLTLDDAKDDDVTINFSLPEDLVAGDFYEVYKTTLSTSATTDPGDTMRLITREKLIAGDITAGLVSYTDVFSPAFLSDPLYTNDTEDGPDQENGRPPFAVDVALFKSHLHYAKTKQQQFVEIQLTTVVGLVDGTDSITITRGATVETYTFDTAENVGLKEFQRFTSAVTDAENIELTMKSFARIVNRGSATWYARYRSGFNDAPGKVEIFARVINQAAHAITANVVATGTKFLPNLPTSGTDVESTDDDVLNRLYFSKFEQPDHVPFTNFDPVGTQDDPIVRILALKDVMVILKENDGAFIKTGETEENFVIKQAGPSVKIIAPETAVVVDNAVYCVTTQGVLRIPESGEPAIVSRPIEVEFKKLFSLTNFASLSFAAPYEADRKLLLWTPQNNTDTAPGLLWIYDYLTNSWTDSDKAAQAAHVLSTDDLLYISHPTDDFVLQERKTFGVSLADFQDEDIPFTVASTGTTTLDDGSLVTTVTGTFTYTGATLEAGWWFEQGTRQAKVFSVALVSGTTYTLTLQEFVSGIVAGAATVAIPIKSRVRWMGESAGNPALEKRWYTVQVYMEEDSAFTNRLGFQTDVVPLRAFTTDIVVAPANGWGLTQWGTQPWGDEGSNSSTPLRRFIPRDFRRSRSIGITYENNFARETFGITQMALTFRTVSERTTRN